MTTTKKSAAELQKLAAHRRSNGEFGNREHGVDNNANNMLSKPIWDGLVDPWADDPGEIEAPAPAPASVNTQAFKEATGMSMHSAMNESATLSRSEEIVLGAAFRDPDKSVDSFCKANPGLAPGKARAILHDFSSFLEHNIDSPHWKTSMQERIAAALEPVHESFLMRPDDNEVHKAAGKVDFAIVSADRYGSLDNKMERLGFHELVPNLTVEQADEAFDAATNLKKLEHEDWIKPVEDAVRQNAVAAGHKFDFNYVPPGSVSTSGYGPNPHRGTLYSGWRSITEVNKDARAELKRAQKAGYLPASLKFNVRGEKFSGGQAMRVSVKGTDRSTRIDTSEDFGRRTDLANELNSRIDSIINAWNHTDNDSMTDYFSTNYYTSISYYDDEE